MQEIKFQFKVINSVVQSYLVFLFVGKSMIITIVILFYYINYWEIFLEHDDIRMCIGIMCLVFSSTITDKRVHRFDLKFHTLV